MNAQPTFIELPSESMQEIYRTVQQVSESDLSFFIVGETGVGKEGVAQCIHKSGPRHNKPFVAINCGRFASELLQSELFGHEAGAFTGANQQRKGAFEKANGGVLFLDEITEMPLTAQQMLLRVLDTRTFTRLGGNENLTTDIQIISATNQDIGEAVLKAKFRSDLFYRLMGLMLDVLPLRDRPEDIAPLAAAFIVEFTPKRGKGVTGITPEALAHLEQAAWPGNIRQLKSTIQTAVALATTDKLEVKDFPYNFCTVPGCGKPASAPNIKADASTSPEFVQTLISVWKTLPPKTQQTVRHELLTHLPEISRDLPVSNSAKTEETGELLNITDMNQHEILRTVAQRRIEEYVSLGEAADSLGIDIRTLQKHAHWKAAADSESELDFF